MANGRRPPIFKPSETLKAVLSTKTVLPIKSSSALSPPPLQKNPNLKPLKGRLKPPPPILTQQMSLLPTAPKKELPETRPHPPAISPPKQKAMTPKPQKISTPIHRPGPKANHFLSGVARPEGPIRVPGPFSISDASQTEETLRSFSANPTRYRKTFLRLTQTYHLTWNDLYYFLNATLSPDGEERV